jgi:hypothetical protein
MTSLFASSAGYRFSSSFGFPKHGTEMKRALGLAETSGRRSENQWKYFFLLSHLRLPPDVRAGIPFRHLRVEVRMLTRFLYISMQSPLYRLRWLQTGVFDISGVGWRGANAAMADKPTPDNTVHRGWLIKSPPEKKSQKGPWKLFRAVSKRLFVATSIPQCPLGLLSDKSTLAVLIVWLDQWFK